MNRSIVMAGLMIASLAFMSNAVAWVEIGDAGLGTVGSPAQGVGLPAEVTSITGALTSGSGNPDACVIRITSGAAFSATTVGGTAVDTQLFLFRNAFGGVAGAGNAYNNDDFSGPIPLLQSTLPVGNPILARLPAGFHVLAVSGYDSDPISSGGAIFPIAFPGVFGPTGPGGGSPLSGWTGSGATGGYTIFLTGASGVLPPCPSCAALFTIAAMAGRRRRRA